jgi:hypothetical protein
MSKKKRDDSNISINKKRKTVQKEGKEEEDEVEEEEFEMKGNSKLKIGYVAMNRAEKWSTNHSFRMKSWSAERVHETVSKVISKNQVQVQEYPTTKQLGKKYRISIIWSKFSNITRRRTSFSFE